MKKRKLLYILSTIACGFTCIFAFTSNKQKTIEVRAEEPTTKKQWTSNTGNINLATYFNANYDKLEYNQAMYYKEQNATYTYNNIGFTKIRLTYMTQIYTVQGTIGLKGEYALGTAEILSKTTKQNNLPPTIQNEIVTIQNPIVITFDNYDSLDIAFKNFFTMYGTLTTIYTPQYTINELTNELAIKQQQITTLQNSNNDLQTSYNYYYSLSSQQANTIQQQQSQITSLTNQITTLQETINTKNSEIQQKTNQITSLNNQINLLNAQIEQLTEDSESVASIITSLNNEIAEKTTTIANLQNNITTLTAEKNNLQQTLETTQNNLETITQQYETLLNTDLAKENTELKANNATLQNALDHADSSNFDIIGTMFTVLTMPFTFISQAFNLTLFPNTPYQINFANLFKGLIAIATLLFIVRLLTNGLNTIGNVQKEKSQTELNRSQTQLNKAKTEEIKNTDNKND